MQTFCRTPEQYQQRHLLYNMDRTLPRLLKRVIARGVVPHTHRTCGSYSAIAVQALRVRIAVDQGCSKVDWIRYLCHILDSFPLSRGERQFLREQLALHREEALVTALQPLRLRQ